MPAGAITGYIDVAQLTLYAFWIFFFGLIFYLRREDKREGFPMVANDGSDRIGFPALPRPKAFLLPHGGTTYAPRAEGPPAIINARASAGYAGAPLTPLGDPQIDGIGPASYADRRDVVELTLDGVPLIVPMRAAADYTIAAEDPDPRGMEVLGGDGIPAGTCVDLWVDRSETIFRYVEIRLLDSTRTVLVPMALVQFLARRRLRVRALRADQFATIPALKNPDAITLREEDRIVGYVGGGQLYAMPGRIGPLL